MIIEKLLTMISNNTNMSGFSVPFFYIDNRDLPLPEEQPHHLVMSPDLTNASSWSNGCTPTILPVFLFSIKSASLAKLIYPEHLESTTYLQPSRHGDPGWRLHPRVDCYP